MSALEPICYLEPLRKYPPEHALDVPTPLRDAKYYARQVELLLDARDNYPTEPHQSSVERFPRTSLAIACAIALGVLWRAWERLR